MIRLDALTLDEADQEFIFSGKLHKTLQYFALRITKKEFTHQYLYLLDKFYYIQNKLKLKGMVFGIFYCYQPHVYKVMFADYTETKLHGHFKISFDQELRQAVIDIEEKITSITDTR